jgi:hypothetical protein
MSGGVTRSVMELDRAGQGVIAVDHIEDAGGGERLQERRPRGVVAVASGVTLPLVISTLDHVAGARECRRAVGDEDAADVVVVGVADHHRIDLVGRGVDLGERRSHGADRGAPRHRGGRLRSDPRVEEQHTPVVSHQPGADAEPPRAVGVVDGRVRRSRGGEFIGRRAREGVRHRLVRDVDVQERGDLDGPGRDGLVRHGADPITGVPSAGVGRR